MNAVLIPGNVCLCVRVLALVLALSLHFCVWRGFAGPLLAKAEGVPGIFGEGKLPGEGCDIQRSPLWFFKINLCHCCCALELFLRADTQSGFSPDKMMSHLTLGFPLEFDR